MTSLDQCVICPSGTSCSVGSMEPKPCLPGSFANATKAETCSLCFAGEYQDERGQTGCKPCIRGFYCAEGAATPVPCPSGSTSNGTSVSSVQSCAPVPPGFWAPTGTALPKPCPTSGFYCPGAVLDVQTGGSEPIIIPVGGSTTTEEVAVVKKELTLDISVDDYDELAVKEDLAALYGVSVELISISANAGSLQLVVSIVPPSDGGDAASVASLMAMMETFDNAALSEALNVNVSSMPAVQTVTQRTVSSVCPKGHWCTAGKVIACLQNYYNPHTGANNQTACVQCPENAITNSSGSTSTDDCFCTSGFDTRQQQDGTRSCECVVGFGLSRVGGVQSCQPCGQGTFKLGQGNVKCEDCASDRTTLDEGATSVAACVCKLGLFLINSTCKECPFGSNCTAAGTDVESMPLKRGYWRAANTTDVIRRCYSTSSCPNVNDSMCATGSGGAFCEVCLNGYHKSPTGECASCEGSMGLTIAGPLMIILLLVVAALCVVRNQRAKAAARVMRDFGLKHEPTGAQKKALELVLNHMSLESGDNGRGDTGSRADDSGSALVKGRILISLAQVLSGIGVSFNIPWPPYYSQVCLFTLFPTSSTLLPTLTRSARRFCVGCRPYSSTFLQ